MFYGRLEQLCSEKHLSVSAALSALGISKSGIKRWKEGGLPNSGTAKKLADFLGISVDDLLDDGRESAAGDDFRFALSGEIHDLTEEEIRQVRDFVRFLRARRESDKDDVSR